MWRARFLACTLVYVCLCSPSAVKHSLGLKVKSLTSLLPRGWPGAPPAARRAGTPPAGSPAGELVGGRDLVRPPRDMRRIRVLRVEPQGEAQIAVEDRALPALHSNQRRGVQVRIPVLEPDARGVVHEHGAQVVIHR